MKSFTTPLVLLVFSQLQAQEILPDNVTNLADEILEPLPAALTGEELQASQGHRLARVERDMEEVKGLLAEMGRQVYNIRDEVRDLPKQQIALRSSQPSYDNHLSRQSQNGCYTVKSGDTLSEIAESFGISTRSLMAANPRVSQLRLQVGTRLHLPGEGTSSSPTKTSTARHSRTHSSNKSYQVKSGDTFSSIARRHGVSSSTLMNANPDTVPTRLQIGKKIRIPTTHRVSSQTRPIAKPRPPARLYHAPPRTTSQPKQTHQPQASTNRSLVRITKDTRYSAIARAFNTSVASLNHLNRVTLSANEKIKAGSEVYVPKY